MSLWNNSPPLAPPSQGGENGCCKMSVMQGNTPPLTPPDRGGETWRAATAVKLTGVLTQPFRSQHVPSRSARGAATREPMIRGTLLKSLGVLGGVLLVATIGAFAFDDKAQSPVEVYEWSVWVGNPAQPALNASRIYNNAMPTVVGTSRPKVEDRKQDDAKRFPLAPVSVVQFYGDGGRDLDVDLKAK